MKTIELTTEQKEKFLEMCNKLFPEYKEIILTQQKTLNFRFKQRIGCTSHIANMSIHWFEFCMTHLINTLAWENITSEILADCQYENARLKYLLELAKDRPDPGQFHPVDYLYEEFKKLKL